MIASRTPEGFPSRCHVCGAVTQIEFSDPGDDAPCPSCGHLLLRSAAIFEHVKQVIASALGIKPEYIEIDTRLSEIFGTADSLDTAELMMELLVQLPDDPNTAPETIGDLVKLLMEQREW
jgi:acyl carrier protein